MNKDFTDKIEYLINIWEIRNIKINTGVTEPEIDAFEKKIDFLFPEDFKIYLTKINGFKDFEWDNAYFSFWSIDRIKIEIDNYHPKELICFSDYSINLCSYGLHRANTNIKIKLRSQTRQS